MANPYWSVVLPVEKPNMVPNPSAERGTRGAVDLINSTVGSTSSLQQFGAWSYSDTPVDPGNAFCGFLVGGTLTTGNGTQYTMSVYVRGVAGASFRIGMLDASSFSTYQGTATFTTGGTWQRYAGQTYTEANGANWFPFVVRESPASASGFQVDGVQFETGSLTTYVDGDQDGCYWTGLPHASTSVRSGTYRGGGSVVSLASLGFSVDQMPGVGMPPVQNTSQSFALFDGGEFQRQRAKERPFTLTGRLGGTTQADYHITRQRVIDALKIDLVSPQQPTRFWYTGGPGTVCVDAVYDAGLEGNQQLGETGFGENAAIRFVANNPMWYATTDQGTGLSSRANIGSANFILRRDPLGRWGTMGQSGTTFQGVSATGGVSDILAVGGTVFACGSWGTAGGTKAPNVAMYFPQSNTWGTLGVGTVVSAGPLQKLAYSPWGSLYVAGFLQSTNGTNTRLVAQWNAAGWGSLPGGTIGTSGASWVQTALFNAGTLFLAGPGMVSFAGTTGTAIGFWARGVWGTLAGGTITGGNVSALTMGLDKNLYLAGAFTGAAGSTANRVASWNGAGFGTLSTGMDQSTFALATGPSGVITAGGLLTTAGGGSAASVADWNGIQWSALGSGILNTLSLAYVFSLFPDQLTGDMYATGIFTHAGGLRVPDSIARYNSYAWLPLDVDITQTNGTFLAVEMAADRSLYAGGSFTGTARAASVAQIYNTSRADAYPTLTSWNPSNGTARLFQLVNTLTGDGIYFNYTMQPGEQVTLDLTPGARSFTSDYQGNIFGAIIPGSNVASWHLASGTNYVSFYADNDSLVNSFYWRSRSWSNDAGTTT